MSTNQRQPTVNMVDRTETVDFGGAPAACRIVAAQGDKGTKGSKPPTAPVVRPPKPPKSD